MRSAEKQPEAIQLNTGMDQSNGTRGAAPGTFEVVRNCRVKNGGLQKRCGSAAVVATVTAATVQRTISDTTGYGRPTEHAAFLGRLVDQRLAATSAGWAFTYDGTDVRFAGEFSAAQPVRRRFGIGASLPTAPAGPFMPGCAATSTGYVCTAAGFGAELRVTVESPTGEQLLAYALAVGSTNVVVRVVAASTTKFFVIYQSTGSTTVSYRIISIVSGGVTNANGGTLVTLNNASSCWDTSYYDGTTWFLVYQSAATTVTVSERDSSAAQTTSVTFASTDNLTNLSLWADAVTDRVWVGVLDDPAGTPVAQYRIYTDALVLSVGPASLATAIAVGPPLFGPLYSRSPAAGDAFGVYAANNAGVYSMGTVVVQAGALTRELSVFNVIPVSKPDIQQRAWAMTYASGTNFAITKAVLLRFVGAEFIGESTFDPTPIVELASPDMEYPGASYHPFAETASGFHSVAVTSESAGGKAYFAIPFVLTTRTNASGATEPTTRVDVYEYTRHNQEPHRGFSPNGTSGFVSGQPTELWGVLHRHTGSLNEHGGVEVGFAHGPSIIASQTTPDANGLAAGSYVYQAFQQWVDDEGNRHISSPSEPFTLTLAVKSSVQLDISNCYIGQRPTIGNPIATRSPATFLCRTQDGGTEAQVVPVACAETSANWVGWVRATDTVADTVIDDNEFIYTAGGVLPNVLAPSCRYISVSEERLWCGGLWDSNIIECSKVRVPGEPYNFTGDASHQVVIPGEVSGMAYMDGQLAVFTEDAIYLVSGDGPNDQGAGGFAPPRALVRGVGCPREQSASILETEIGILFRSKMGVYLIPRGYGSPEYIGEKVHNEDSVVLSASTSTTSEYRLAHFLVCAVGETKSDTVLTLDLTSGHWFRDTYTVDGSITGQGFSEIGEWPDGLALMSYGLDRTDNLNIIWAHDEDLTGDAAAAGAGATTYVPQYVRTNWIRLMGPVGLMRLAEVVVSCEPIGSSSGVTMLVETDSNTDQSLTWTLTTSEEVSYRNVVVTQPQCTEFRVTLSDAAGASNSAGVRFLALGFAAMPILGIRRGTDSEGG